MNPFMILPFLLLIAAVLLVVLWFTIVKASTILVTYWLGAFDRVLRPGPHLVKWPFETSEIVSTATRQFELPDEPENIDRESKVPPAGKKAPYRINHKGKEQADFYLKKAGTPVTDTSINLDDPLSFYEKVKFKDLPVEVKADMAKDPLTTALQSEISVAFEWHVKADGKGDWKSVQQYIENVGTDQDRSREEEIRKRADDMVSFTLQDILGQVTMRHASDLIGLFSSVIQKKLEMLVGETADPYAGSSTEPKPWGIHIVRTVIKQIYGGKTIAEAMSQASAAVSKAQDNVTIAQSEKDSTILKSEGDREAEINKGKGEAGRIKEMAEVLQDTNARFAAALDVAEQVLPHCKPIIIQGGNTGGMGEAVAAVLSLGASIQNQQGVK